MISLPSGSVWSMFSTVRLSSWPSLRLMTTTLILSAILLKPDIARQFAQGKHQRALARRKSGEEPPASHMFQGEASGVKMAHRESLAGRLLGEGVQGTDPDAAEPIALRHEVQESPVRRPRRVPLQPGAIGHGDPLGLGRGNLRPGGSDPDLRGVGRVPEGMKGHPFPVWREPGTGENQLRTRPPGEPDGVAPA